MIVTMSVDGRVGQDGPGRAEVVRARWSIWGLVLASVVAGTVVALLLVPVLPWSGSNGPAPAWRETTSAVLDVVGIVLIVVGIVHAARKGLLSSRYAAQAPLFSRDQRRRAQRCVRRGQRAPQELGAAAVFIAQMLVRQRHILILLAGFAVNVLANVVTATNPVWAVIEVALVVMVVVLSIVVLVTARGARRWLQTYDPATSSQSGQ